MLHKSIYLLKTCLVVFPYQWHRFACTWLLFHFPMTKVVYIFQHIISSISYLTTVIIDYFPYHGQYACTTCTIIPKPSETKILLLHWMQPVGYIICEFRRRTLFAFLVSRSAETPLCTPLRLIVTLGVSTHYCWGDCSFPLASTSSREKDSSSLGIVLSDASRLFIVSFLSLACFSSVSDQ